MQAPASDLFTPISLTDAYNQDRDLLQDNLKLPEEINLYGAQSFRGIPFELGTSGQKNVIEPNSTGVEIDLAGINAAYVLFLHCVENRPSNYQDGFASDSIDGRDLGQQVSSYQLNYADGSSTTTPILRRFAIQQSQIGWGSSPFAAVPAFDDDVYYTTSEDHSIYQAKANKWTAAADSEKSLPPEGFLQIFDKLYGRGETRHTSSRDSVANQLWLYALPNPHPEKAIQQLKLISREERSVVYAITCTTIKDHPLRPGTREKLKLKVPESINLNALSELDGLDIDLGKVISARAALNYDPERWQAEEVNVQPEKAIDSVIIEYAAHPQAKLYLSTGPDAFEVYNLADLRKNPEIDVKPAIRPVKIRVVEKGSNRPVAVRLHMHGQAGEYLPPKGYHRKVNPYWFEDNYGEFVNSLNQYCYIPGECEADLPLGQVFIEISRGYEVKPIRESFEVTAETEELTFEIEKILNWREQGWVTADTHVHFLSPTTALLEGQAEGVNVVNLLASQWGEMFSNVSDFDGKTTLGAKDFGGDGEFLVRVGTENRMQVLGHISLLGYSGSMIHPLCTGGPSESAIGDPLEVTMADWARRCTEQGGLVVLPHGPDPQCERAADIVLGHVDAIEMMTFNPYDFQISPYGIADWYRYLNLGYHLPIVGGSDKMAAASLLGGIRTYAHLGDKPFTYENWMAAVQAGNTFVTVGPLIDLVVEGQVPGSRLDLPEAGGSLNVSWKVASVNLPLEQIELVVNGLIVEQINLAGKLTASGITRVVVKESSWIALRVRASYQANQGDIAAHSSAVQVSVAKKPLFSQPDAITVLEQIEGSIAYVDTLAPRPEAKRYKQLRATLESAYNRLHQRMHQQGVFHKHSPLHGHDGHHEH